MFIAVVPYDLVAASTPARFGCGEADPAGSELIALEFEAHLTSGRPE
jgi:hypothetical protein